MTTLNWTVPGYTELGDLGKGSQGRVILARRDKDDEFVAIKYLEPRLLQDTEEAALFRTEAEMLAQLDDPNVARLYAYEETENGAAIIMERITGVTLRAILEGSEDGISPEAALLILKGSLMGLAAAHAIGVVHRDYKPTNIMVQGDGRSKLIDFGIAVLSGGMGRAGTPAYMAPEQWRGESASPATDIYAATCVFYECITGHRPYTSDTTRPDTATSLEELHLSAPVPTGDIPRALRRIVTQGMAKTPQDRPASAHAFVTELETAATAAYGRDWEKTGRAALAAVAATLIAALPAIAHPALAALQGTAHSGIARLIHSKVAATITGVAAAGAVTAYLLYPSPKPKPSAPPPPALTYAQAQQVLNNYLTVANQADHNLDINQLSTVETKPELDLDSAYFTYSTKYHLGPVMPTDIRQPQFWIPRIPSGQRWFVVHTGPGSTVAFTWYTNGYVTDDPGPGHTRPSANSSLLFAQQSNGTWKLALIADPPAVNAAYPQPILDKRGYAQEISPNGPGYAMPLQQIPTAYISKNSDQLFGKGTCTYAPETPKGATPPPSLEKTGWTGNDSQSLAPYPVYALKTNTSAIVWTVYYDTYSIHKTNPRSPWTYGVGYSGVKQAHTIFANRETTNMIDITVIIDPAKTTNTATATPAQTSAPPSPNPPASPLETTDRPWPLACGNTIVSYDGS